MKLNKKIQVHMLPTEDKTLLYLSPVTHKPILQAYEQLGPCNQHLYFTSDEEIKEGDWCLYKNRFGGLIVCKAKHTLTGMVYQVPNEDYGNINGGITPLADEILKIIFTTDTKLTCKHSIGLHEVLLPQLSQSFIEAYVKAGGIDKVLVEYIIDPATVDYAIQRLIPKVNSQNEITIHPIKSSWTREEVTELSKSAYAEGYNAAVTSINNDRYDEDYKIVSKEDWITENL